jgi:transcriptional regulator with XRE-family HTH domain
MKDKQRLIKKFRNQKGYSQEDMAERLGISQNSFFKIENGRSYIKADMLKKIATILEKDIIELLEQDDTPNTCNIEQHNPQHSVANVGNDVIYNEYDFENERAVWQNLEKSLRDVIISKDALINVLQKTINRLEKL